MTTIQYIVHFLADFLSLLPMYTFLIGCYVLWRQTYRISWGHHYLGQIAMATLVILDVLFTYPTLRPYGQGFRPVVNTALTSWVLYNGWFFYRYPIPWKYLQAGVTTEPGESAYKPRTWIGSKLIRTVPGRPFWFSVEFKWIAIVGFFVLISAYFIQQLASLAVASDARVVAVQKNVDQKFSKTAKAVTSEVTKAVAVAFDTLQRDLNSTNARADTALRKAQALKRDVDKNASGLSTIQQRVNRAGNQKPTIILYPTLRPAPPKNWVIPDSKVEPIKPRRTGKYGYLLDESIDSTLYAQYYENK